MSNEKCPFVVGSGYLTRDGRPALCIGMNPSGDPRNKVVFAVGVPGDTYVYATKIDGTFLRDSMESVDDIIPPAPKEDDGGQRARSDAWLAVAALLSELRPDWDDGDMTGRECALAAIREMAAPAAPQRVENDDLDALRSAQAHAVMPLIGPLLDAWDQADPDDKECVAGIAEHIEAIADMMENHTDPQCAAPAAPAAVVDGQVIEDEDGMPVGYADWYYRYSKGQVDTKRDNDCESAWRAAISGKQGES